MEVKDTKEESPASRVLKALNRVSSMSASKAENTRPDNADSHTLEREGHASDRNLPNGESQHLTNDSNKTNERDRIYGVTSDNFENDNDSFDDSDEEQNRLIVEVSESDKEEELKVGLDQTEKQDKVTSQVPQNSESAKNEEEDSDIVGFSEPSDNYLSTIHKIEDKIDEEEEHLFSLSNEIVDVVITIYPDVREDNSSEVVIKVTDSDGEYVPEGPLSVDSDSDSVIIVSSDEKMEPCSTEDQESDIDILEADTVPQAEVSEKSDGIPKEKLEAEDAHETLSNSKPEKEEKVHDPPASSSESLPPVTPTPTQNSPAVTPTQKSPPVSPNPMQNSPTVTPTQAENSSTVSPTPELNSPAVTPTPDSSERPSKPVQTKAGRASLVVRTSLPRKRSLSFLLDPIYRKPFELGWRRELVYRNSGVDANNKRQGDIYYYTPDGKKVRSTRELEEYVDGSKLTVQNFTFFKEPLGLDPPMETIRTAGRRLKDSVESTPKKTPSVKPAKSFKVSLAEVSPSTSFAEPKKVSISPAVSKTVQVKTFPKIKVTPTLAEKQAAAASKETTDTSTLTPIKFTPPKPVSVPKKFVTVPVPTTAKSFFAPKCSNKPTGHMKKTQKSKTDLEMGMLPPSWKSESTTQTIKKSESTQTVKKVAASPPANLATKQSEPCSIRCPGMEGVVPSLHCRVCLCMYHSQCAGLGMVRTSIENFVCKFCQKQIKEGKVVPVSPTTRVLKPVNSAALPPTPLTSIAIINNTSPKNKKIVKGLSPVPPKRVSKQNQKFQIVPKLEKIPKSQETNTPVRAPAPPCKTIVGSVTTWLPPSSTIQLKSQIADTQSNKVSNTPFSEPLTITPTTASVTIPGPNSTVLQGIANMGGKKFVVVPRHNILSFSPNSSSTTSFCAADPAPLSDKTAVSTVLTTQTQSFISSDTMPESSSTETVPDIVAVNTTIVPPSSAYVVKNAQNPASVLLLPVVATGSAPICPSNTDAGTKNPYNPQFMLVNGFGAPNVVMAQQEITAVGNSSSDENTTNTESATETSVGEISKKNPSESRKRRRVPSEEAEEIEDKPPEKQVCVRTEVKYSRFSDHFMANMSASYFALLNIFEYLKVHELLRAARVCRMWSDLAGHSSLWRTVRMKNSNVCDWDGFADALTRRGTQHLDLKKMLIPSKVSDQDAVWKEFCRVIGRVTTLKRIDLCRCPPFVVEHVATVCSELKELSSLAIRQNVVLLLKPFEQLKYLETLRLKSNGGLTLSGSLESLVELKCLKHLALTTVKDLGKHKTECLSAFVNLESFEIGDCSDLPIKFADTTLAKFTKLKRLRLENVANDDAAYKYLKAMQGMKDLTQLELINFNVKNGFEAELPKCSSILKLLIIPSYVSQSATTNHTVLSAILKMDQYLTHFVWGVTHELLRVTELFVDQCEVQKTSKDSKRNEKSDSIPVLKPVPGGQWLDKKEKDKEEEKFKEEGPDFGSAKPQVEIVELPKLHKLLSCALPQTKIKLLKIPYHATWRQYLSEMHG